MARSAFAGVVLAILLACGCASAPVPFPSEPRAGSRFHSFAMPEGPGPFPAIVLLHACGGVRPHIAMWMETLKARGYASLAVDSFTARGGGECVLPHYFPASMDEVADDAIAALEHLRSRPGIDARRIGVMGFSYGGAAALRLASPRYHEQGHRFGAVVALYPICTAFVTLSAEHEPDNLRRDTDTPTLILIGSADWPSVVEHCAARVKWLQDEKRPAAIRILPGAGHGFDFDDGPARREAAAEVLRFFDRELRSGASPAR
jgi:dienelactone hydrolase